MIIFHLFQSVSSSVESRLKAARNEVGKSIRRSDYKSIFILIFSSLALGPKAFARPGGEARANQSSDPASPLTSQDLNRRWISLVEPHGLTLKHLPKIFTPSFEAPVLRVQGFHKASNVQDVQSTSIHPILRKAFQKPNWGIQKRILRWEGWNHLSCPTNHSSYQGKNRTPSHM